MKEFSELLVFQSVMSGIDVQEDKEGFQRKDSFWNGC